MNENNFQTKTSTVAATSPHNSGTEIWVRYDDGREASYQVPDPSFRCREGHQLTAVLYGPHPILLRNDSTGMKIQLHAGEDILGGCPHTEPFSVSSWLGCIAMFLCPPFGILLVIGSLAALMWSDVTAPIKMLAAWVRQRPVTVIVVAIILATLYFLLPSESFWGLLLTLSFLSVVFGIPYWQIIRPRIHRFKHQRRINAANRTITRLFKSL